jgi:hypothetical protein
MGTGATFAAGAFHGREWNSLPYPIIRTGKHFEDKARLGWMAFTPERSQVRILRCPLGQSSRLARFPRNPCSLKWWPRVLAFRAAPCCRMRTPAESHFASHSDVLPCPSPEPFSSGVSRSDGASGGRARRVVRERFESAVELAEQAFATELQRAGCGPYPEPTFATGRGRAAECFREEASKQSHQTPAAGVSSWRYYRPR